MDSTVKHRVIQFIEYENISVREFERRCGLSYGYVNNMRVSIQPDRLKNIATCFPELNTGWLITGEGEMLKGNKTVVSVPVTEYQNSKQDEIDRLNRLVQSQQDTIHKLTELLYERKGVQRDAEVAGVG